VQYVFIYCKHPPCSSLKGGIPKDDIVPLRIIEIKATAFVEDTERSSLGVFYFNQLIVNDFYFELTLFNTLKNQIKNISTKKVPHF